jgi:hypothetical protein
MAKRLNPSSPLDSVIEIVDSSGTRFSTCRQGNSSGLFNQSCLNDDIDLGIMLDSRLEFQVPGEPGTPQTFYIHVLDWNGNARPDFFYDLVISGAN